MILQSKDKFNELAHLNLDTGEVTFISKGSDKALVSSVPAGGYSNVNGKMCSLYRVDGKLYLSIGERTFEVTNSVMSRLIQGEHSYIFQLLRGGNLLLEFTYVPPTSDIPLSIDPTPFIEEEDFDFLRFVHNVLNDTGRRQRVYNQA